MDSLPSGANWLIAPLPAILSTPTAQNTQTAQAPEWARAVPHPKPPGAAAAANVVSGVGSREKLDGRERQRVGPPTARAAREVGPEAPNRERPLLRDHKTSPRTFFEEQFKRSLPQGPV
jgi:hypothetical protein